MTEDTEQATRRAAWTSGVYEVVDGVPFANLGDEKNPLCVSALVTDARMERWLSLGYVEYEGDRGDEVDRIIGERAVRTAEQEDHRAKTIAELEDNNRRLSMDLVAARQKIAALVDGDQSGSQAKVAELADQLKAANARLTELEAGILEAQEGDGPDVIGALTADAVLNELRRIADLPQGFKKELQSLIALIDGEAPAGDGGQGDEN